MQQPGGTRHTRSLDTSCTNTIQQAPFCREQCNLLSLGRAGRDWRATSVKLVLLTLGNYRIRQENIECSLGANIKELKNVIIN